jgi:hypothetical protein
VTTKIPLTGKKDHIETQDPLHWQFTYNFYRLSSERVWFGYEGKTSNKLKVVAQGEDGLQEMVDETSPHEQLYEHKDNWYI